MVNARRPEDSEVFKELVLAYPVGATVEMEGRRGSEDMKWKATLSARPADDSELLEYKDELFEFTARQISAAQKDEARERGEQAPVGVSILKVEGYGWAALGGLTSDDIILGIDGASIDGIDALKDKLKALRKTKPRSVTFGIRRGPRTQFLEIEPKW